MKPRGRPWSEAARARTERRRAIREQFPDVNLGDDRDHINCHTAPLGFCKFCGLRNPCNSCMDGIAAEVLRNR
jgi:hypothetical protein